MTNYYINKQKARDLAIQWQTQLDSPVQHSWQWCIKWSNLFHKIGRKYGLIREFKENGLI